MHVNSHSPRRLPSRALRTVLGSVSLAALASGCGPSEAPPPGTAAAPHPKASPAPVVFEEDRTPVETAPKGLFFQAHAVGPRALVRALKGYLPASAPQLDPRAVLRELTQDLGVERIVDIDKPIDVAAVLPEHGGKETPPSLAIALGVEDDLDLERALEGIAKPETIKGGVVRLSGASGPLPCVVAPAIGPAKRRLVCAAMADPLDLAPWLARGVTRLPEPAAPIHLELQLVPVKERYQPLLQEAHVQAKALIVPEVKIKQPEIDKVLKRVAQSTVDEVFDLVADLDALALDVMLPPEGVELGTSFGFGGQKSWTARAMLAAEGAQGAAPKLGALPSDSAWLGAYAKASPQTDALLQPIQTALRELVDAAAIDMKWPAKDKDLVLDVVKYLFPAAADASFVSGEGGEATKAKKTGSEPGPYGRLARSIAHALERKSFTVSVAERDSKAAISLGKAIAAWVTRPSFAQTLRTLTRDRLGIKIAAKPLTAKELPKGSWAQRYDLELFAIDRVEAEPSGKKAPKPKETSLGKLLAEMVVIPVGGPDGARSWSGFGQNLAPGDLVKRVVAAMAGGAPSPLSSRPGYAFATQGAATSGGLMMLDGLFHTLDRTGKSDDVLAKLPDQGRGTIAWRVTPSATSSQVSILLPRDLISALMILATR